MVDKGRLMSQILRDIEVELGDELDRNFERQGFFSEKWERRKSPTRKGDTILIDTGSLRRSIRVKKTSNSITFSSELPYAAIHNEGGEIKVTAKMKGYFWYKYRSCVGSFGRKKNGDRRNDQRTIRLSEQAEFWKAMALKKVGSVIKIPKRQFLGINKDVEEIVRGIIEENCRDLDDIIKMTLKQ